MLTDLKCDDTVTQPMTKKVNGWKLINSYQAPIVKDENYNIYFEWLI